MDYSVESHNTFLELADGKKVLSRGRAINVPVVTSGFDDEDEFNSNQPAPWCRPCAGNGLA